MLEGEVKSEGEREEEEGVGEAQEIKNGEWRGMVESYRGNLLSQLGWNLS